jgi:hypothetical protein
MLSCSSAGPVWTGARPWLLTAAAATSTPSTRRTCAIIDDRILTLPSALQAIQTWKPTANSTHEASLAESQATVLINTSSTTTTSTAKTRKPKSTSGGGLND